MPPDSGVQATGEQEINWEDVSQVDLVSLDIGYGLIPLVNTETGGQLLTRVKVFEKEYQQNLDFSFNLFASEIILTSNQIRIN